LADGGNDVHRVEVHCEGCGSLRISSHDYTVTARRRPNKAQHGIGATEFFAVSRDNHASERFSAAHGLLLPKSKELLTRPSMHDKLNSWLPGKPATQPDLGVMVNE
jgi:hypothetical protein